MQHIDEKFKDNDPVVTVEKIQGILRSVGIEVTEKWNDSGVEHCYSLSLSANKGVPSANGKGITKEFARASAYGEFIERLQGGLFFYKFQSICRQKDMNIQSFAPDAKYSTADELVQNGVWMDYLIQEYKSLGISRESIIEQCKAYACSNDGRILTIPFYSLFDDEYVYLPAGFVDQMYATNGCCVGNTKEEAWVHALSEMMERHASLKMLLSGAAAPRIPDEVLFQFPTVSKILRQLRKSGEFDVEIFDYSLGNGFPIISTRIISKKTHSYRVNVAADPVFEIAIQRTLTELFQGKNIHNVTKKHNGLILGKVSDIPAVDNVINQLETSSGLYTADYFANELTNDKECSIYADNSRKNNKELLEYMLGLYRQLGKPVYVRNFSYLGFACYRFVVPGFSEALSVRLAEKIPEYAIAEEAGRTLRNIADASDDDLQWMLIHSDMIRGVMSRYHQFGRIAGIPLSGNVNLLLACVTRAYAAYRLKQYKEAIRYATSAMGTFSDDDQKYISCVNKYLDLMCAGIRKDKIRSILYKFFDSKYPDELYRNLDDGLTPYDKYLIRCDYESCQSCQYQEYCSFHGAQLMNQKVGKYYNSFANGQDRAEFALG